MTSPEAPAPWWKFTFSGSHTHFVLNVKEGKKSELSMMSYSIFVLADCSMVTPLSNLQCCWHYISRYCVHFTNFTIHEIRNVSSQWLGVAPKVCVTLTHSSRPPPVAGKILLTVQISSQASLFCACVNQLSDSTNRRRDTYTNPGPFFFWILLILKKSDNISSWSTLMMRNWTASWRHDYSEVT